MTHEEIHLKKQIKSLCKKYFTQYSVKSEKVSFSGFGYGDARFIYINVTEPVTLDFQQQLVNIKNDFNNNEVNIKNEIKAVINVNNQKI